MTRLLFTKMCHAVRERTYTEGRKLAIKQAKLAKFGVRVPEEGEYPMMSPFSIEQILDEDFYQESPLDCLQEKQRYVPCLAGDF